MSKLTAEDQDIPDATPQADCGGAKGAKTTTVFGALLGAAAAAPT